MTDSEAREQFQKWYGPGFDEDFKRDSKGIYYSRGVRRAWELWQAGFAAGRLQGLEEAAKVAEDPMMAPNEFHYLAHRNKLATAIREKK